MAKKKVRSETIAYEYLAAGGGDKGAKAVASMEDDGTMLSRSVLRAAMKKLKADGREYAHLENWCIHQKGFGLDNRRNSALKLGEKRSYTVQEWRDSLWLKLPMDTMSVEKGSRVDVHAVDEGRITISLPEPEQEAA